MLKPWIERPTHLRFLEEHGAALGAFGAASATEFGFGWLDSDGDIDLSHDLELWINCRMTHCFSLLAMEGFPQFAHLADHGVTALSTHFRDAEHGGFFAKIDHNGRPTDDSKQAYAHAFVVLAASSAAAAGRSGAEELLDHALSVLDEKFFEPEHRLHSDVYDRAFTECEPYRGINANMHSVEALLAAAAVLSRDDLLDRAVGILERAINEFSRSNNWSLPEHYSPTWEILKDYNRDDPAHPFRPYGATIGHWFEWARLSLHARAGLEARETKPAAWMLDGALALLEKGAATFGTDGARGFAYTLDWDGAPVVAERMHWVMNEAIGAAAVAYAVTGDSVWAERYQQWWEYAAECFVNPDDHSWAHELSAENGPSATVWAGKPDIYHAYQCALLPRLPVWPPFSAALAMGDVK